MNSVLTYGELSVNDGLILVKLFNYCQCFTLMPVQQDSVLGGISSIDDNSGRIMYNFQQDSIT